MPIRHLHQVLTYWAPAGTYDTYGKPLYLSPVQYNCRWEDKQQNFVNKIGTEKVSKSRIFLSEQLDIDGFVFLGTSVASDPTQVSGAREIQALGRIPDLRNLKSLTTVFL